jgi:hypothetical protein
MNIHKPESGLNAATSTASSLTVSARNYKSFIVAVIAFLFIMQVGVCILLFPEALQGRPDFRAFYTAGYMVRTGHAHQLLNYDASGQFQNRLVGHMDNTLPFYHLPYEALLFVPFSLFGYRTAFIGFFAMNLGLLAISYWMAQPFLIQMREIWKWLPAALFLCFAPITIALIQGQDSIILLAMLMAAFIALQKGKDFQAGLLTGLTLFKFQFALPIFFLFIVWGWRRATAGFVWAVALVTGISVALVGISSTASYPSYLVSLSTAMKTEAEHQRYGIYPIGMPNLRGIFYSVAGSHLPHVAVQAATLLCSVLLLFFISRIRPSFPAAILAALLISYHGNVHDAAVLLIPMAAFSTVSLTSSSRLQKWIAGLSATILILPTLLMVRPPGMYWLLALPVLALLLLSTRIPAEAEGASSNTPSLRAVTPVIPV